MATIQIRVPPRTPSTQTPRMQFEYCPGTLTLTMRFGTDTVELHGVDEETSDEIENRIGHVNLDNHIVNAERANDRAEEQASLEAWRDQ